MNSHFMEDAKFHTGTDKGKLACTGPKWAVSKFTRFYCVIVIARDLKGVGDIQDIVLFLF